MNVEAQKSRLAACRFIQQAVVWSILGSGLSWASLAVGESRCSGPFSDCIDLEIAPSSPFGRELSLLPQRQRREGIRVGIATSFQSAPLRAVAASPDPNGRELPIVDNWVSSQILAEWRLSKRWRVGLRQPLSWGSLSGSTADPRSLDATRLPIAFGDPALSVATAFAPFSVLQRVTLPFGAPRSWLHQRAVSYAPAVAWDFDWQRWSFGALVGAHFRRASAYADIRFGVEGDLGLGAAYRLNVGSISGELLSRPSWTRDESATARGSSALRRIPTTWLIGYQLSQQAVTGRIDLGGSLPLSTRQVTEDDRSASATFSGPPGADFQLRLTLSYSWTTDTQHRQAPGQISPTAKKR